MKTVRYTLFSFRMFISKANSLCEYWCTNVSLEYKALLANLKVIFIYSGLKFAYRWLNYDELSFGINSFLCISINLAKRVIGERQDEIFLLRIWRQFVYFVSIYWILDPQQILLFWRFSMMILVVYCLSLQHNFIWNYNWLLRGLKKIFILPFYEFYVGRGKHKHTNKSLQFRLDRWLAFFLMLVKR